MLLRHMAERDALFAHLRGSGDVSEFGLFSMTELISRQLKEVDNDEKENATKIQPKEKGTTRKE